MCVKPHIFNTNSQNCSVSGNLLLALVVRWWFSDVFANDVCYVVNLKQRFSLMQVTWNVWNWTDTSQTVCVRLLQPVVQ